MEREEVGRKSLLGCLSIVSFWMTGAVQQPAFYIGILSALLWPYCILFHLYLSLFLPLLAPGRGEINHHTDRRVPMSGYLPLMDLNELCLQMNADSLFICALSPTPPPEYLSASASDEQCLLLPDIPYLVTHISHLSDCSCPSRLAFGSIRHIYPSCSRRDKGPLAMDSSSPPIASSSRVTLDNHSNDRRPLLSSSHSNHQPPIPHYRSISPASDPNPNPIPRRNMVSTMLGFTPKRVPESSVKDVAVFDPTASAYVDPQTGALIEEKSKAERWFVARLDAVLLVFVCISQVIKYLDQQSEYSSSPLTFPPHPW